MNINKERTKKLIEILYDKDMKQIKYLSVRAFLIANPKTAHTIKEIVKGFEEIGISVSENTVRKGLKTIPDRLIEKNYFRSPNNTKYIAEYKVSNDKDIQLLTQLGMSLV